jgi:hypothetical protein
MRYLLAIILLVISTAQADTLKFELGNDIVADTDNGLTHFVKTSLQKGRDTYSIANYMFTPRDLESFELPEDDRGFDGYSYLGFARSYSEYERDERIYEGRLGVVGEWSGSEALQKYVHIDLDKGADPSWSSQNPSEVTGSFLYTKHTWEYTKSYVGDARFDNEYGVEVGTFKVQGFINQTLTKHYFKRVYLIAGIEGRWVLYDTTLDGRLTQDNVYTIDSENFVAVGKLGFKYQFTPDFGVTYTYFYETATFEGQIGRHDLGSITLEYKF